MLSISCCRRDAALSQTQRNHSETIDACISIPHFWNPYLHSDSDDRLTTFSIPRLIEKLSERVILLEGWRATLLAVVAGALSALSLAPIHAFPVLFFTIPVFVWLLDGAVAPAGAVGLIRGIRRFWPAFKVGWLFGFGYFLAGFWWVGEAFLVDAEEFIFLLPFAVIALPAGLALFWGVAAALSRLVWGDGWIRIVGFAAVFALAEWVRGSVLTGLPWNVPGYAAMPVPLLMQSSALIGLYGITFFTLLVAAAPAIFAPGYRSENHRARGLIIGCVLVAVSHLGYGFFALLGASSATVDGVKLRLVQPAIDQSEKWDAENEAEIMNRYLGLSNANRGPQAASVGAFTHVIWPESAFPFILTERRDQLAAIAALLPPTTTLITGAMRLEKAVDGSRDHKVFNSLYLVNGNGEIVAARDKTRLLPFGEFLPFQDFLENLGLQQLTQLRGGFASGTTRRLVEVAGTPAFLPLICYEIIFSGAVRSTNAEGGAEAKWIVNLTNDAWFGMTSGPYQHAHQSQVRAVEEGLPVVRAANNGISFVADAHGRIIESLALGERGVVDASLPVARPRTIFSITGNMPFLLCICVLLVILVGMTRRNTQKL